MKPENNRYIYFQILTSIRTGVGQKCQLIDFISSRFEKQIMYTQKNSKLYVQKSKHFTTHTIAYGHKKLFVQKSLCVLLYQYIT